MLGLPPRATIFTLRGFDPFGKLRDLNHRRAGYQRNLKICRFVNVQMNPHISTSSHFHINTLAHQHISTSSHPHIFKSSPFGKLRAGYPQIFMSQGTVPIGTAVIRVSSLLPICCP
jgi:hypothetical protein